MSLNELKTKEKRDTPLTVRLPASTVKKLKVIAEKKSVSQADLIEYLIETAHKELGKGSKSK